MASESGTFWLPPQASTFAGDVDAIFDFIYWLNIFFFVAITGAVVYFAVKYRRKSDDQLAVSQVGHNTLIESAWTFIPLVLVIVIFAWGFRVFLDQTVAPDDAFEINVTAKAYSWSYSYPSGEVTTNLIVPDKRPIKLIMHSEDLLHSFFVPDFRVKSDVIPGRYTTVWFEAKEPGEHVVFCTEYCGAGHSGMLSKVIVLPQDEWDRKYEDGLESGGDRPPAEWGKELYTSAGCLACHSVDGTRLVGPSWKGLYGSERKLADGTTAKADENYLRESILQPMVKVVESYPPSMPSYQGQLSDKKIAALIAYIKTLK